MAAKPAPACLGEPPSVFYEDLWQRDGVPFAEALATARSFCDGCPVRGACLADAMAFEKGQSDANRAGVWAGTTPQQRHSLEKRGSVSWEGADPAVLCRELPDRGDQWIDRHTDLAQAVIAWSVEFVAVGAAMPSGTSLARKLGVRPNDVRRVYAALVEDCIFVDDGAIRRSDAVSGTVKGWLPRHLRSSHSDCQ